MRTIALDVPPPLAAATRTARISRTRLLVDQETEALPPRLAWLAGHLRELSERDYCDPLFSIGFPAALLKQSWVSERLIACQRLMVIAGLRTMAVELQSRVATQFDLSTLDDHLLEVTKCSLHALAQNRRSVQDAFETLRQGFSVHSEFCSEERILARRVMEALVRGRPESFANLTEWGSRKSESSIAMATVLAVVCRGGRPAHWQPAIRHAYALAQVFDDVCDATRDLVAPDYNVLLTWLGQEHLLGYRGRFLDKIEEFDHREALFPEGVKADQAWPLRDYFGHYFGFLVDAIGRAWANLDHSAVSPTRCAARLALSVLGGT